LNGNNAITLFFSPEFGTLHEDQGIGQTYYVIDEVWANRIKVAIPIVEGEYTRTTFQLGRHENCWVQFGAGTVSIKSGSEIVYGRSPYDSLKASQFNVWSRIQCTLAFDPRGESYEWIVMTGGAFRDGSERVVIDDPRSGVYLNGQRIRAKDQIALFSGKSDSAFLCFGHTGKIFIRKGAAGEDSTALPESLWRQGKWPTLEQVKLDGISASQKRFEIEQQSLKEQEQNQRHQRAQGATLADLGLAILNGPEGMPAWLYRCLLALVALVGVWVWRR
jgi:hypothetical protein